ncbi:MAG TPA: hypothetical protein VKK79_17435 [Candidatus Lokiarchaeia archaeon]|nr:hypothetical protein [Candidatus Lokiarchaeia archaeon]
MAEKGSIFDVLRRPIGNLLLFLFKLDLAVTLMFYTYILLVVPLYLWGVGTFGSQDTFWLIALFGGMFGLILLAWSNASNRSGILFAMAPLAFNWWLMDVFLVLGGTYNVLPLAGMFGLFSIVLTSIVVVLATAVLIAKSVAKYRAGEGMRGSIATIRVSARQQRRYAGICLGLVILCGSYVGITIQSFPQGSVTVTPQNYTVNFAFWAITSHWNYSQVELQQLNTYGVTLVGEYNKTDLEWWMQYYPNVRFSLVVYGNYADENAKSITQYAEQLINDINTYNFTNVIGETFDWEGSGPTNASLHAQAVQIWADFLTWKEEDAPPGFRLTLLSNIGLYFDKMANPNGIDMHQLAQAVDFEGLSTEKFNEYAPMYYRCTFEGAKPYGDPVTNSTA